MELLRLVISQDLESDSKLEDEEDEFAWMDELEEMDAQQNQAPTQDPVQTSSKQTLNVIDETSPDFNPFHRNTPAHIAQKYINAQLEHSKPQTVKRSDNQDWSPIDEMIIAFGLDISLHSKFDPALVKIVDTEQKPIENRPVESQGITASVQSTPAAEFTSNSALSTQSQNSIKTTSNCLKTKNAFYERNYRNLSSWEQAIREDESKQKLFSFESAIQKSARIGIDPNECVKAIQANDHENKLNSESLEESIALISFEQAIGEANAEDEKNLDAALELLEDGDYLEFQTPKPKQKQNYKPIQFDEEIPEWAIDPKPGKYNQIDKKAIVQLSKNRNVCISSKFFKEFQASKALLLLTLISMHTQRLRPRVYLTKQMLIEQYGFKETTIKWCINKLKNLELLNTQAYDTYKTIAVNPKELTNGQDRVNLKEFNDWKVLLETNFYTLVNYKRIKKAAACKDQKLQEIADAKQFGFVKYKEPVKFKKLNALKHLDNNGANIANKYFIGSKYQIRTSLDLISQRYIKERLLHYVTYDFNTQKLFTKRFLVNDNDSIFIKSDWKIRENSNKTAYTLKCFTRAYWANQKELKSTHSLQ